MANKKKDNYPSNVWEYVDWLYTSGRLTAEEHGKLKGYIVEMDTDLQYVLENEGC